MSSKHSAILHLHRSARATAPLSISQGLQYKALKNADEERLEIPDLPVCNSCSVPFIPGITVQTRIRFKKLAKNAIKKSTHRVHRKRFLVSKCTNCMYVAEQELDFQWSTKVSDEATVVHPKAGLRSSIRSRENISAKKRAKARKQSSSILRQILVEGEQETKRPTLDLFSFIESTE
jgi:hypothetical protein